jgi:hypothetical protein
LDLEITAPYAGKGATMLPKSKSSQGAVRGWKSRIVLRLAKWVLAPLLDLSMLLGDVYRAALLAQPCMATL